MTKKTETKLDSTVPVGKSLVITVASLDGARQERELWEEFAAKVAKGYVVDDVVQTHRGVDICMSKTENWTMEEFITGVRLKLSKP